MSAKSKVALLQTVIGNRSLREWDTRWEPLINPFSRKHDELRRVPGLFRITLDGETKYICRAIEKQGIPKGLQRISGPEQSGNKG